MFEASKSGLGDSISFRKGDASDLSFADNSLLKELARVVKPGGTVFILIWSSQIYTEKKGY